MNKREMLTAMTFVVLFCSNVVAQAPLAIGAHDHQAEFKYRELTPPPLMRGIGNASLKITTNSDAAQAYFNQGLRLLHCFWGFEAYRAFNEAARLDPSAAMAYWGEFEALKLREIAGGPVSDEGKAALKKATALADKVSEHEQLYIRAAEHQLKPGDSLAYQKEMEILVNQYPNDVDAQAFRAYGYMVDGGPSEGELRSETILNGLLAAHPENAAANHYWIHAMESGPHPEAALHSAEVLASMAPNSGHIVHMPGHIYWRLGDYEKARQSFLNSMRVDETYMAAERIKPEEDWNYAHNLAYLITACAEAGRYHEGLKWAKKLRNMRAPLGMTATVFVTWAGGSVARVHFRFRDWSAVAHDPIAFGASAASAGMTATAYSDGLDLYAKGMVALERGDAAAASRQAEALDALLSRLQASEYNPWEDRTKIVKLLETFSLDLRGDLKIAEGDNAEGFNLLQQAAEVEKNQNLNYSEPPLFYRPEQENVGYAYLKAKEWENARNAFNEALRERPKSGHALYGIALSYAMAGDASQATAAYRDLLANWQHADSDLPQVKNAKAWLASHTQ